MCLSEWYFLTAVFRHTAENNIKQEETHRELTTEACASMTGFLKWWAEEEKELVMQCTPELVKNILMFTYHSTQKDRHDICNDDI